MHCCACQGSLHLQRSLSSIYCIVCRYPCLCTALGMKESVLRIKDHEQDLVPVGVRKQPHIVPPTLQEHRLQAVAVATACLRYPLPRPSRTRLRLHACVRRMCTRIDAWHAAHSSALRVTIGKTRARFLSPSWPRRQNPCRAINFPSCSESSHQTPSQTMWIAKKLAATSSGHAQDTPTAIDPCIQADAPYLYFCARGLPDPSFLSAALCVNVVVCQNPLAGRSPTQSLLTC